MNQLIYPTGHRAENYEYVTEHVNMKLKLFNVCFLLKSKGRKIVVR